MTISVYMYIEFLYVSGELKLPLLSSLLLVTPFALNSILSHVNIATVAFLHNFLTCLFFYLKFWVIFMFLLFLLSTAHNRILRRSLGCFFFQKIFRKDFFFIL